MSLKKAKANPLYKKAIVVMEKGSHAQTVHNRLVKGVKVPAWAIKGMGVRNIKK